MLLPAILVSFVSIGQARLTRSSRRPQASPGRNLAEARGETPDTCGYVYKKLGCLRISLTECVMKKEITGRNGFGLCYGDGTKVPGPSCDCKDEANGLINNDDKDQDCAYQGDYNGKPWSECKEFDSGCSHERQITGMTKKYPEAKCYDEKYLPLTDYKDCECRKERKQAEEKKEKCNEIGDNKRKCIETEGCALDFREKCTSGCTYEYEHNEPKCTRTSPTKCENKMEIKSSVYNYPGTKCFAWGVLIFDECNCKDEANGLINNNDDDQDCGYQGEPSWSKCERVSNECRQHRNITAVAREYPGASCYSPQPKVVRVCEECPDKTCSSGEFSCGEKCIPIAFLCDGHVDCADERDELPSKCRAACNDGDFEKALKDDEACQCGAADTQFKVCRSGATGCDTSVGN